MTFQCCCQVELPWQYLSPRFPCVGPVSPVTASLILFIQSHFLLFLLLLLPQSSSFPLHFPLRHHQHPSSLPQTLPRLSRSLPAVSLESFLPAMHIIIIPALISLPLSHANLPPVLSRPFLCQLLAHLLNPSPC